MRKRVWSVLLSAMLLFGAIPTEAYADTIPTDKKEAVCLQEPELPTGGLELPEGEEIPEDVILNVDPFQPNADTALRGTASGGLDEVFVKGAGTYGKDHLSAKQQAYYEKLEEAATQFMVSGKDIEPGGSSGNTYYCSDGIAFNTMGLTQDEAVIAYVAFGYDHPAYYWLHGYAYTSTKLYFRTREEYKDAAVRETINRQIISAAKRYAKEMQKGGTDFEKVLILHDELAEAADYAYVEGTKTPVSENWAHSVIGIVDEDYAHVVCEGYAKAFSFLLNYTDIPNVYIIGSAGGGGHAWNLVSYDNGATYVYVDLTWDDLAGWYKYMGMPKADFEKDHVADQSDGTGYSWLYDLPDTITTDFEGTYYYKAGKYAAAGTDVNSFLNTAQTDVLRFGRQLSVITDEESVRRQLGNGLGINSYYKMNYLGTEYYCINKKLRDTRYVNPVSDFGFGHDEVTIEVEDEPGGNYSLPVTFVTPEASDDYLFWKSSAPDVVRVDTPHMSARQGDSVELSLLKLGSVILTATSSDHKIKKTFRITVMKIPVEGVSLNETVLSLEEGETAKLEAAITPENATNLRVSFGSSDNTVASVEADGTVTARSVGKATITVTTKDGHFTADCEVTVKPISVKGVSLKETELSLEQGETGSLTALIMPSNAANQKINWISGKEKIATVDADGTVTAVAVGKVTITAETEDGHFTADCNVTVKPISVKGMSLKQTKLALEEGETDSLTAVITPLNAADQTVFWKSGNEKIVTVDTDGNLTAVSVGTTSVTARTQDGNFTDECEVTVKPVSVKGVSLTPTVLSLEEGEQGSLAAQVKPFHAANQKITWASENEKIATVSGNGIVTAVSAGTTTVTVLTEDGNFTADCKVTVKPIAVRGVSLTKTALFLEKGEKDSLTAMITPSNAADQEVLWTSGNDKVAMVSGNGIVTAVSAGTTSVTVVTKDGGYKAECKVTVADGYDPTVVGTVSSVGTVRAVGSFICEVTSDAADAPQVSISQPLDTDESAVILPVSVTIEGVTYQVTSIADNAFKGNKKLKSITIPETVRVIGKNAFSGCSSLKKVTIPAGVREIGTNAFRGNKSLKKITVVSKVLKKIGKNAFKGIHKKAVIKVPKKQKKAYQKLFKKKGQAVTVKIK